MANIFNVLAQEVRLKSKFDSIYTTAKPDYSLNASWAALPFIKDFADTSAGVGKYIDGQSTALADVFFIHPTSFTYKPDGTNKWNGDVADKKLNQKTNEGSIRYQASVFSGSAKIYAPYYRQAHYFSYLTQDTSSARQAFAVAYSDVKSAFEFYLKNYNNNRPIIIASHSQGTNHAIRLIQEFFDNKPLSKNLVCAYLVGIPVYDSLFQKTKPCKTEKDTGCYCTWRTFDVAYHPQKINKCYPVCTNPLSWTISNKYSSAILNTGGILRNMRQIIPGLCDAQSLEGVLKINKPNFRGSAFLRMTDYHIADYNLFYSNIKGNAMLRIFNFTIIEH